MLLAPFSIAVLLYAGQSGTAAFGQSTHLDLLLALAGVVTTAPLLLFAAAARRLPLATLGLLQYIAPTLQFAEAVLLFGEPMHTIHIITFTMIWTGCALYAFDAIRAVRAAAPAPVLE